MEEGIKEIGGIDLLDEYDELLREEARKPITFAKNKKKTKRLSVVYEEVFRRMLNYRD